MRVEGPLRLETTAFTVRVDGTRVSKPPVTKEVTFCEEKIQKRATIRCV
jgi:hypothetical protein